jgi:hypothetical protein
VQTPWFSQADQTHVPLLQVPVWVPQLPQGCVEAPGHCWFSHASHWQVVESHVCVPPVPQAWVVPGTHTPWLLQVDHSHVPLLQVVVCVPQFPHACVVDVPEHCWFSQGPHWQVVESHVCVPPVPQAWVVPGVHEHRWFSQGPHWQVVESHVCVPPLPQAWVVPAAQIP